jgi:pimeloyl-ACP methyl ester carboxylesterase
VQRLLASPVGPLVARLSTKRSFDKSMRAIFGPQTQPSQTELEAFWQLLVREDGKPALAGLIDYMRERREHRARWVGALLDPGVPVRIINGSLDPVSGEHLVKALLALEPKLDVVRLQQVGHYPQVEDPDAVLRAFNSFIASVPDRARSAE